jgi:uncharacterized protein YndB with AHSA1/START domain
MENTTEREIVVEREIDAPRELVFAAFTELEHAEQWWVPSGTTTHEHDPSPGGLWRYSMPGPDGNLMPFKVQFVEINKPAEFIYDYGSEGEYAGDPVRTHVTFEDADGKTRVRLQLVFATAEAREQAAQYGAANGAKAALGSLAKYLEK